MQPLDEVYPAHGGVGEQAIAGGQARAVSAATPTLPARADSLVSRRLPPFLGMASPALLSSFPLVNALPGAHLGPLNLEPFLDKTFLNKKSVNASHLCMYHFADLNILDV